ncbi:MAG: hypothetical protein NTZ27_10995 [Ignavibacteriales bacterium]|nr:hypothetical protein [Ignavibacteriales bacterium]
MRTFIFLMIICFSVYFITGCDKGIEPEPEKVVIGQTGFRGTITFVGAWPDSVKQTMLVVFKNQLVNGQDFGLPNLSFVVGPIPNNSPEYIYSSDVNSFSSLFTIAAGQFSYVVVAQSKKESISLDRKDWFIVGVYCIGNDQSKPGTMTIQDGAMTHGIDINVDFNNPPPQPPM